MKSFILLFVAFFSTQVFARQYIQCNSHDLESTDVAVVNLTTVKGGTLFISSGMQNDESERTLVDITFAETKDGKHIYNIVGENTGTVTVPSEAIGQSTNFVDVDLSFNGYFVNFSCFSRIYND